MKTQDIFIAHPKTEEEQNALMAFLQALKITFEVSKKDSYNPEFTKKILESIKQASEGKVTRVEKENLKEYLGL